MKTDLVEVYDLGAGHTEDNLVVWLPAQKILFGGCLIKSLNSSVLGYTAEADMQAWPLTVAKVQAQFPQMKMVVPGHGKVGDKALLTHTIALLNNLSI
jgi:glyoxylase-like metal-dependent hydrolase (beta-lactamase superfamily II)